jgi:predicted transcriptional regulator
VARKGEITPDAVRSKQSIETALPMAEKIERDAELLRALGQTKTFEFAEISGVAEATAKNRLRRLHEHGLATRFRERGSVAWTYVTVIRPGETVT